MQTTLKIRSVTDEDCQFLWELANDPTVRASSFQGDPIPWEQHLNWFHMKRGDPNCYMYIVTDQDDHRVGQVRFDLTSGLSPEANVGASIVRSVRGRGYGVQALQLACHRLFETTRIMRIAAYIKPGNLASIRAFEHAGFAHQGTSRVGGAEAIKMILERADAAPMLPNRREVYP